jgi:hypothetical protein
LFLPKSSLQNLPLFIKETDHSKKKIKKKKKKEKKKKKVEILSLSTCGSAWSACRELVAVGSGKEAL